MDVRSEGRLSYDRLQKEVNIGLDAVKETGKDGDLGGDEVLEMVEGFWRWRWQRWDTGEFFLQGEEELRKRLATPGLMDRSTTFKSLESIR